MPHDITPGIDIMPSITIHTPLNAYIFRNLLTYDDDRRNVFYDIAKYDST